MAEPTPIEYYNRLTQKIETEAIYGEKPLRFVYENPLGRLALHALVKRALFSKWYGMRMDAPASAALIQPFIDKYGLDSSEFADSAESYTCFNDFFSRKLKPLARPMADEEKAIVFPADGRHWAISDLSQAQDLWVKGLRFDLKQLLGDSGLAARFEKGSALISRLCPTDYHRFHFPCAGMNGTPRLITGDLFSVSPIALMRNPKILWQNQRYLTRLRTDTLGEVAYLEIGATCVGKVVHTARPNQFVNRGAEKGYFRFGGSCVMLLFEPGKVRFSADLLEHNGLQREVYAQMGDVAALPAA